MLHGSHHNGTKPVPLNTTAHMDVAVSSRFTELRGATGSIFIDEADLKHVKRLGEGAFANVEECVLRGQHVAVKRLKPEMFADLQEVNDFVLEGVLISQVHHPCIVEVKGLGFKAGDDSESIMTKSLFMAQELCNGGSLRDKVLAQMQSWHKAIYTYADGLRWATQIAQGLAHLHDQDPTIIHRDLKLDNILLSGSASRWDAKIADFGLVTTVRARDRHKKTVNMRKMGGSKEVRDYDPSTGALARSAKLAAPNRTTEMSNAGSLKRMTMKKVDTRTPPPEDLTGQTGSFLNMAPEVVLNEPYDEKADIFSMGCCYFEIFSKIVTAAAVAVTGDPGEFEKIAHSVAEGYRRPLPEQWPAELKVIVTACMAQRPQDRPSADQVVARLQSPQLAQGIAAMDGREAQHLHSSGCCSVQ